MNSENHSHESYFFNRELSILDFNKRVLFNASDKNIPLLERLKYLCIVSNNLDEFFEIRVASLLARGKENIYELDTELPHEFVIFGPECKKIVVSQYELLNKIILPELALKDINLINIDEISINQKKWLKSYFEKEVRPVLTSIVLDPSRPFPQIVNKSLNFIIEISGKDAFGRANSLAIIKVPRILPRIICLPQDNLNKKSFCLLSSIIQNHIPDLFPNRKIINFSQFRVTRNSDLWVDEEEVKNLRQALKSELKTRNFGFAVRLEVSYSCPSHLADFLLSKFRIAPEFLFKVNGPVNLVRLIELTNMLNKPELKFSDFNPNKTLQYNENIFSLISEKDILLHHPFQSFQPVLDLLNAAAIDPEVIAIKQTIYRAGLNSELIDSLVIAAQNGKEVVVVVELLARFEEDVNINWADKLEQAGAHVVYGIVGLKTHAKMLLIIRREDKKLKFYAHMGTGNYHTKTVKLYTDFGIITANPKLTKDVNEIFINLTSLTKLRKLSYIFVAPFDLHKELTKRIINEKNICLNGGDGRIIAKMNSLTDQSIIKVLYEASNAGVKVDLIIRGACLLRPGIKGMSENIKVRSIIGRFLEHHRIFYFKNNNAHDIFLSSADWMNRNLYRRIEIAFPILENELKQRVLNEGLNYYLKDNKNAWELDSLGEYSLKKTRNLQNEFSAQSELINLLGS